MKRPAGLACSVVLPLNCFGKFSGTGCSDFFELGDLGNLKRDLGLIRTAPKSSNSETQNIARSNTDCRCQQVSSRALLGVQLCVHWITTTQQRTLHVHPDGIVPQSTVECAMMLRGKPTTRNNKNNIKKMLPTTAQRYINTTAIKVPMENDIVLYPSVYLSLCVSPCPPSLPLVFIFVPPSLSLSFSPSPLSLST